MIAGVLVVDKPSGPTSHDIVAMARRGLGERRIGHCGTLDPMATGVVVLAIGPATRLVQFLAGEDKHYLASVRFGVRTASYDLDSPTIATSGERPARSDVERALDAFRGTFRQQPPAYSAKKVGGVRAYELARRDLPANLDLQPVEVHVARLDLDEFDGDVLQLSMQVSAGFYVRSLAHDLGEALGMGAVLEALCRTRSGSFPIEAALPAADLATSGAERLASRIVPLGQLLPQFPARRLEPSEVARVRHGQDVPDEGAEPASEGGSAPARDVVRLMAPGGDLLALAQPGARPGFLHPFVVLG